MTDFNNIGPCPNQGSRTRDRACHFGVPGDLGCIGNLTESESCIHEGCGYWASWQEWTDCSKSCGNGEKYRERACINGILGETGCPIDKFSEVEKCNTDSCPRWSSWVWGDRTFTNLYSKNPEIFQSMFKIFVDVIPARHLGAFVKRNVETQHPFDSVTAWAPPLATPGVRD